MSQPAPASRRVRLFRNNRNQAIRIPVEFELPGSESIISRDGDLLIAALAQALGATIVTANLGEFQCVEGLNLENWLA